MSVKLRRDEHVQDVKSVLPLKYNLSNSLNMYITLTTRPSLRNSRVVALLRLRDKRLVSFSFTDAEK